MKDKGELPTLTGLGARLGSCLEFMGGGSVTVVCRLTRLPCLIGLRGSTNMVPGGLERDRMSPQEIITWVGGVQWAVPHRLNIVGTPHRKFSTWSPSFYEQCRFPNVKIRLGTVRFIWPKTALRAHLHIAVWRCDSVSTAMHLSITDWPFPIKENISLHRFCELSSKSVIYCKRTWRGKNNTVFARNQTVPNGILEKGKRQSS